MATLVLGFVGGCLTHQPGIPHPRLFHRLVAHRLEDERGVRLRLALDRDFSAEPGLRVANLLRTERPDVVVLHRSTNTFFAKAMAVFVTDRDQYVVNPFLFRRSRSRTWLDYERDGFRGCTVLWTIRGPGHAPETRRPETPESIAATPTENLLRLQETSQARGFRLKDLTWIVADRSGLVEWAIEDELRIVRESHAECTAAGVPLIVLGPGLRIGMPWVKRFADRLDASLADWASTANDAAFVSLLGPLAGSRSPQSLGVEHYMDVIHFNAAGHEHVADRLEPWLNRLVSRLPSAR